MRRQEEGKSGDAVLVIAGSWHSMIDHIVLVANHGDFLLGGLLLLLVVCSHSTTISSTVPRILLVLR